jgi:hypothetical protein
MEQNDKKDYFSPNINDKSKTVDSYNSCDTGSNAGVCLSGNRPGDCTSGSGAQF